MELINQGLIISAIGLVAAFTSMALFIGVIVGLQKLFPAKREVEETVKETPLEAETVIAAETSDVEEEAVVAALAVALAYQRARSQSSLGADLLAGRSTWWSSNLLASRQN